MLTVGNCSKGGKKFSNESCPKFIPATKFRKPYMVCSYCRFWTLTSEMKQITLDESMCKISLEQQLRREIGCYRCTILNGSCHLTCVDYKEKILPKLLK